MLIHPAHTLEFDELVRRLRAARDQRLVYERAGPEGLTLYVYSEHCVYEQAWDAITIAARGLILDHGARRIVATPFPKFFNAGERDGAVPDLPFEVTEKLDGSLIIIFHHRDRWLTATKGAFDSTQAQWSKAFIDRLDLSPLEPGVTYLAEATYPENKIVVPYPEAALRLLGAYSPRGTEVEFNAVAAAGEQLGIGSVRRLAFTSIAELMAMARTLPRTEEGYVLRFNNGARLKIKGDEYKRIHALISGLTPLAMWEAMRAGSDMQAIRRDLPEEYWADFDAIVARLEALLAGLLAHVGTVAQAVENLTDKELGMALSTIEERARPFVFDYRNSGGSLMDGRSRDRLYRTIRPTGNVLPGYVPSFAVSRVKEDSG